MVLWLAILSVMYCCLVIKTSPQIITHMKKSRTENGKVSGYSCQWQTFCWYALFNSHRQIKFTFISPSEDEETKAQRGKLVAS